MVRVCGMSKTFLSGRGTVKAIRDLSFGVKKGESLVVVGKSGSGKTTLLNCIGGLERVDKGVVACGNVELSSLSARALSLFQRRAMGFVFQSGNLISYMNVSENIGFPLALNRCSRRQRAARTGELLERVGLGGMGAALPHELSAGEVQRAAFARAIAHRPGLLLADEPTANLDSKTGKALIELMFSLGREQCCTLVVATHDQELIAGADDKLVLKDGMRQENR